AGTNRTGGETWGPCSATGGTSFAAHPNFPLSSAQVPAKVAQRRAWKGVEAVRLDPMIPPAGAGPPAYPASWDGTSSDPDFGAREHPIDGNPRHVYPPIIPDRHP